MQLQHCEMPFVRVQQHTHENDVWVCARCSRWGLDFLIELEPGLKKCYTPDPEYVIL